MTFRIVEYKDVSPEVRQQHKMKKEDVLKISEKRTGTFVEVVRAEDVISRIQ